MDVRFAGQPFADEPSLLQILSGSLAESRSLTAIVAWAKRSGLSRLAEAATKFRKAGGHSSVIVGIDEGGATYQGLQMAIDLFDDVFVFHDRGGRTMHTKGYLVESESKAVLVIGSNNLTAGGLFFNYEAALVAQLNLADANARALRDQFIAYVSRVLAEKELCIRLTPEVLEKLRAGKQYRIQDEDRRRQQRGEADRVGDSDSDLDVDADSLFGTGTQSKHIIPSPRAKPAKKQDPIPPLAERRAAVLSEPVLWWSKRLSRSDAQQLHGATSNPTNTLRLSQAGYDIDWRTFFRQEFFGELEWRPRKDLPRVEEAQVPIELVVDGQGLGTHNLLVDYDSSREAYQANITTFLHWGEVMGRTLKSHDYTGCFVVLEKFEDLSFRLTIRQTQPA
jgi:HKD family nuclease